MILRAVARCWPKVVLPPRLTNAVAAGALLAAFFSGMDYIALPDGESPSLTLAEQAAPLDTWGWILIGAVMFAISGWLLALWWAGILAHMLLAGVYVAFGVSGLINVAASGASYGWRTGVSWLLVQGVVHFSLGGTAWVQWDKQRAANKSRIRHEFFDQVIADAESAKATSGPETIEDDE